MRTRTPPLDDTQRLAIVLLYAQGESQSAIAKRRQVSQGTVSRVLAQAEHDGVLARSVHLNEAAVPAAALARARALAAPTPRLQAHIAHAVAARRLPHDAQVHVLRPLPGGDGFLELAAPIVRELVCGGVRVCGLTWGNSVARVIDGVEALQARAKPAPRPVTVVPLCGDPLGDDSENSSQLSSNTLAQRLSRAINAKPERVPSLAMLPAFLPGDFKAREVNTVWRLIEKMRGYETVFGGRAGRTRAQAKTGGSQPPFAQRLDMVITGISSAGQPLGAGRGPLIESGALSPEAIQRLVLADIGGVLIERPGLSPGQWAPLTRLRSRWTGLAEHELLGCAERAVAASSPRRPGVVLIAAGTGKAEPTAEALRRGFVNHLLIDEKLESELCRLIPAPA